MFKIQNFTGGMQVTVHTEAGFSSVLANFKSIYTDNSGRAQSGIQKEKKRKIPKYIQIGQHDTHLETESAAGYTSSRT